MYFLFETGKSGPAFQDLYPMIAQFAVLGGVSEHQKVPSKSFIVDKDVRKEAQIVADILDDALGERAKRSGTAEDFKDWFNQPRESKTALGSMFSVHSGRIWQAVQKRRTRRNYGLADYVCWGWTELAITRDARKAWCSLGQWTAGGEKKITLNEWNNVLRLQGGSTDEINAMRPPEWFARLGVRVTA